MKVTLPDSQLVLYGWEVAILTVLVWTPASLHLFVERLRPEVLKLARAICFRTGQLPGDDFGDPTGADPAAEEFIKLVHAQWPTRGKR